MRYEDRTNRVNSNEDADEVSRLLNGLRRVDAPSDFDFKLKARIAIAKQVQAVPSRIVPVMMVAVPLCLLLFLASGYFVLTGTLVTETATIPANGPSAVNEVVSGTAATGVAEQSISSTTPAESEYLQTQPPIVERAAVQPRIRPRPRVRRAVSEATGGGSIQRDLTISNNTIRPPKSSDAILTANSAPRTDVSSRNAASALSSIGADAAFVNGELKVRTVKAGSRAESAGLKAGDIVRDIDEKSVNENTSFDATFKAKSLNVAREGKTVNVVLDDE